MATKKKTRATTAGTRGKTAPAEAADAAVGVAPPAAEAPGTFPVVGIGASAGGLEAIESLFRHMPVDTGMAFVLVQHLDPNHASILSELIARYTRMPVLEAAQGQRVLPDHVYVIPPKCELSIVGGVLQLVELQGPRHLRLSIDYFFRSLAQDLGSNAVCVVLSGAGSDGALGVRAIKGEGGTVLAQEPESAAYDSMPRSAIATGLADAVLPPREMGAWIEAYGKHFLKPDATDRVRQALETGSDADRLFHLVRNHTGYDFSQYKEGTIGRRIERRMVVNRIDNLEDYVRLVQQSPEELDRLWRDFLIRVTQFFRNPRSIAVLEDRAVPALLENRATSDPIRVWVPGCSTGEEAYTIAMLILDRMEHAGRTFTVQVFATDIDEDALKIARLGIYPASIAADVPPRFLRQHFVKHPQGFQMSKALRNMLIFARHDITRDPPFSRMDLVSCRNLLIYLRPPLQSRVLDALTYALKRDGMLFLGHSESLGEFADMYSPVDKSARLFRRRGNGLAGFRSLPWSPQRVQTTSIEKIAMSEREGQSLQQSVEATLLAEHSPACVVIDDAQQIVFVHGHTGRFLEPARGRASMNIIKMAREGLRNELGSAIRLVGKGGEAMRRFDRLRVPGPDGERLVNLVVRRLPGRESDDGSLLILFEDLGDLPKPDENRSESDAQANVAWLERELADTRETLQNSNEELETSNEELHSTVEELQSSNEELMTSQEELSSINEELHTVNVELEDKVRQLESTSNDLENLLYSTEIGTIFLDLDLRVRRFTPAASRVINLIEGDIGRPLSHIATKIEYEGLIADAEAVLDTLQPRVLDVRTREGTWFTLRINLYRTGSNAIDGVVLTFVDLTERVLAERRFLDLLELVPDATVITNASGEMVLVNRQAEQLFGYPREELLGRPVEMLLPERLRDMHIDLRRQYQRSPVARTMCRDGRNLTGRHKDGSEFAAEISIGPIQTVEGPLFAATLRDTSFRRQLELMVDRTNRLFHGYCRWDRERQLGGVPVRDALHDLCRMLTDEGGYRICWIGQCEPGASDTCQPLAQSGLLPEQAAGFDPGRTNADAADEPLVIADALRAGPPDLTEKILAWECRSLVCVPMSPRGVRLGMLVVGAAQAGVFANDDIRLLQALAAHLGVLLAAGDREPGRP